MSDSLFRHLADPAYWDQGARTPAAAATWRHNKKGFCKSYLRLTPRIALMEDRDV
jgi:hypothetical protein